MKEQFLTITIILLVTAISAQVTDIDGNTYKTVKIGEQEWMAENLQVSHYSNGDELAFLDVGEIQDRGADGYPDNFDELISDLLPDGGTYTYYYLWGYQRHKYSNLGEYYGYLYNWQAVTDPRNVCPEGWRVPTTSDWEQLLDFLGGDSLAQIKMSSFIRWEDVEDSYKEEWGYGDYKSFRHHYWEGSSVKEGTDDIRNESRFSALPGGMLHSTYEPNGLRKAAYWWAIPNGSNQTYNGISVGYLNKFSKGVEKHEFEESSLSIRCIKN
jgi:uncharacterized protein (TIGR02145 family)